MVVLQYTLLKFSCARHSFYVCYVDYNIRIRFYKPSHIFTVDRGTQGGHPKKPPFVIKTKRMSKLTCTPFSKADLKIFSILDQTEANIFEVSSRIFPTFFAYLPFLF